MGLPSTTTFRRPGPESEPTDCSLVFGHEVWRPNTKELWLKLDKQSVASVASFMKKAVSSAYTRSLNDELLMLMLGLLVMWFSIQSIAIQKCWGKDAALKNLMSFRGVQICISRHELLLQYFHEGQRLNLWAHRGYLCCVEPSTVHDDPRSRRQLWRLGMPHLKVYWTHSGFLRVSRQRGRHRWLICPWWNLTAEACVSCQEVVVCKPRSHVRRLSPELTGVWWDGMGWPWSNFAQIFSNRKLEPLGYRVVFFVWSCV